MKARKLCTALFTALLLLPLTKTQAQDTLRVSLAEAVEIGVSENPIIKIAGKEVERMDYIKAQAKGDLLPTLAGSGNLSHNLKDPVSFFPKIFFDPTADPNDLMPVKIGATNSLNAGLSLSIPIFAMGIYRNIELSNINIQLALEQVRQSKVALKNQIERAYFGMLMATEAYDVMERSMKSVEENYQNVALKFEQGKVAEFDKLRAEVQVSNTRPAYLQAKNTLQLAELQLKLFMGIDMAIVVIPKESLADYEDDYKTFDPLKGLNFENNPDLRQLDIQAKMLNKQLQLQRTARYPMLAASASYSYITQANDFKIGSFKWINLSSVGLSLQVPIFNGFINNQKDRQVKVGMKQLQLQREYKVNSLTVEGQNAINTMDNAIVQVESNKDVIRQAEKAYEISKTRYDSGMSTLLEFNDAEIAYTQAKLYYKQAVYTYLVAKSDYVMLIGNSF